jgi:hypothetical protein
MTKERYVLQSHSLGPAAEELQLGKVVYKKLVFPRYGKPGEAVYPEQVRFDPAVWRQLNEPSDKG